MLKLKKDEFFNKIDESYDKWQKRRVEEALARCESAIQKKLIELNELAEKGCNFGGKIKKDIIKTEEIAINGNDVLDNIHPEIKEAGYDVEVVEIRDSGQPYGPDVTIKIVIQ